MSSPMLRERRVDEDFGPWPVPLSRSGAFSGSGIADSDVRNRIGEEDPTPKGGTRRAAHSPLTNNAGSVTIRS
jgi:hypothetical protein